MPGSRSTPSLRTPLRLSVLLAGVMAVQSALGLLFAGEYRDVAWIRATWFGNDWVTLVVAVPLLATAIVLARRDSVPGTLLWLSLLCYGVYNYAFYLFGAALNAFLPLYVAATVLSVATLILALSCIDVATTAAAFSPKTPVRLVGGYLVFVAVGLAGAWLSLWARYAFAGRPTPVEPEAFKLIAALDLSMMVPALGVGGILLWRRRNWGYVIATLAATQAALYLLVLSVNAAVAIARGLAKPPGELPVWGGAAAVTTITATLLFATATGRPPDGNGTAAPHESLDNGPVVE